MFIGLLILSVIGYSLQGTLMAHYARKMDGWSTTLYRSASLIITMLPLLFFAEKSDIALVPDFWLDFLLASGFGAIASAISFVSLRYLPVGVQNTFGRSTTVIFAFLFGWLVFGETVTIPESIVVVIVLVGSTFLGFQKKDFAHLDASKTKKGIFLAVFSRILVSISYLFVTKISRELSPWVAGYFWEAFIGVFAIMIAFGRKLIWKKSPSPTTLKEFGKIALICSPTLIGTGAFLYAVRLGPYGIATAISAGGIFVSLLIAHFIYHEKLSRKQLFWICVVSLAIIGLELVRA